MMKNNQVHRPRDPCVEKPVAPMERLWRNSSAPRPGGSDAGTSWKHSVDYVRLARPRTERLYHDRERIDAKRAALAEKIFVEQCQGVGLSLHQGLQVLVPNGRPHQPGLIHDKHIRAHLRDASSPDMHARLARKRGKHGAEGRVRALGAAEAARARRAKGAAAAARSALGSATPTRAATKPRRLHATMQAMAKAKVRFFSFTVPVCANPFFFSHFDSSPSPFRFLHL